MPVVWIVVAEPRTRPDFRLFCLPYAGGGAGMFRSWAAGLGPQVEVMGVQLPGREARFAEMAYDSVDEAVAGMLAALTPRFEDRIRFGFFGHSLGAVLAFELARALRRQRLPVPSGLWVSGRRAPHLSSRSRLSPDLPADELLRRLGSMGSQLGAFGEELVALMLPTLRRDLRALSSYRPAAEAPLALHLTSLGGRSDLDVPREDLEAWSAHSTMPVHCHQFDGGHFYLHEQKDALVALLSAEIAELIT
jgi:medium-chain acyl-[acyl-carrier-protein] hydrolase